jgi:hypothetical protein
MSAVPTITATAVLATPAPAPVSIVPSSPWNLVCTKVFSCDHSKVKRYTLQKQLDEIFSANLAHRANVDLIELAVVYTCTDAKQSISAGVWSCDTGYTIRQVAAMEHGLHYTSNAYNYGEKVIFTLNVPGYFTRQIRPPDNRLPPFRVYIDADANMEVALIAKFDCHGPYFLTEDLVFQ